MPQPYRKRRKIAIACHPCRARKIRCDGIEPTCGPCWRRKTSCAYAKDGAEKRGDRVAQVSNASLEPSKTQRVSSQGPRTPGFIVTSGYPQENTRSPSHIQPSQSMRVTESRVTAMGIESNRPIGSSEGQDEFFGDSSVASFLKHIRSPTQTDYEDSDPCARLSADPTCLSRLPETSHSSAVKTYPMPPRQLADYLLNCYFDKIHSLYPFVHRPSFLCAYRDLWTHAEADAHRARSGLGLGDARIPAPVFHCSLNIIFALGCQFSKLDHGAREAMSEEFFQRSQRLLDVISLDKADLALVQTLLLTSQYLQGGESPSRCWNIIGLACRVAQAVGMHSLRADRNRLPGEIQMRRRVWHGCIMLDLASSMMLGRPPMTRASTVPLPEAVDDELLDTNTQYSQIPSRPISRTEFYVHTLHLYKILRRILSEVYEPWEDGRIPENAQPESQRFQILIELDAELESFKSSLPAHLQWHTSQESSSVPQQSSRESSLLRARFLHLRILLLRPTLVKFCRKGRLDESRAHFRSRRQQAGSASKIFSDFSLGCSTSCIEAAIELSFLMNEISRTELASVWWYNIFYTFTAGAVLILAQTYPAIESIFSKQALSDSWKACTDCLETMDSPGTTAKTCASNLQKALAVAMQESVHPSRPNTKSTTENTPETVGPGVGHRASSTYTPTFSPSHPSGEVDAAANRDFLGILESDPFGCVWGQGINDPLPEMLWDEFWLMAPSL